MPNPNETDSTGGSGAAPVDRAKASATSFIWKVWAWDWLEAGGRRVSIPAFVVSLVALYFVFMNYSMTVAANRPELGSNGFKIELKSQRPHIEVDFQNVGKKIGRRGMATLFSVQRLGTAPMKIGIAPIVGAGTNIFPGFGSAARFDLPSIDAAAFFLVCSAYFDDTGSKYEQAFLFQRSQNTVDLAYEESVPPAPSLCN